MAALASRVYPEAETEIAQKVLATAQETGGGWRSSRGDPADEGDLIAAGRIPAATAAARTGVVRERYEPGAEAHRHRTELSATGRNHGVTRPSTRRSLTGRTPDHDGAPIKRRRLSRVPARPGEATAPPPEATR
ncbi:hypothetical protein SSP24_80840 [Streptomyces spinoverrucosus]|uniref:Uncharacterized protein n=1 Tax=Streptomyces spinoverrucosus TaxID=284043 RepID=A0A4Y3VXN1_9ACTN|nr:hypothetical protein SSP24_80840 [Streptomyces spinoverrucosus]GHB48792.1 hypothetical protein GCM10010397_18100 [Streptomyces spinoverrucosus]